MLSTLQSTHTSTLLCLLIEMVYILKCKFHHTNGHVIILLLFLSLSSLTHLKFMAEGRLTIPKHIDPSQEVGMRENEIFVGRRLIGSRPPRCERRCKDCGHCKAVQVPISPQFRSSSSQKQQTISSRRSQYLHAAYSRGDDISSYKPMCWKCQCGDSFFNP